MTFIIKEYKANKRGDNAYVWVKELIKIESCGVSGEVNYGPRFQRELREANMELRVFE